MHFTGTQNSHEWGSSIIEKKCGWERISGTENDYGFETKKQTLGVWAILFSGRGSIGDETSCYQRKQGHCELWM